jgi:hypothetical protein
MAIRYFHGTRVHRFTQGFGVFEIQVAQALLFVDLAARDRPEGSEGGAQQFFGDALRQVRMFEEG